MRRIHMVASAAALSVSLLVAGCSSTLPSPQPAPLPAVAQPVLSQGQADATVRRIVLGLEQADATKDATALADILTGPAVSIRAAQYAVAAQLNEETALTTLPSVLQSSVISTNEQWPRSFFVVTEQPENLEPPRLMVLRQDSARENYRMWGWVRLFPSVELPEFEQSTTGTAEVTDSTGLSADIEDSIDQYVDVLNNGVESPFASAFPTDVLQETIAARRSELGDALAPIDGDYRYVVSRPEGADSTVIAWRTADGGALVVAPLTAHERARGPQGASIRPDDATRALLGDAKVSNRLFVDRQLVIAMVIPPESDPSAIDVVGAENVRVGARTSN